MARASRIAKAALLAVLVLPACSAGEDAIRGAADAAGQEARNAAQDVASEAVRSRVCQVVDDGRVSATEVATLRTVVAGAEGAGLPNEVVSAIRDVIGSGDEPAASAVQRLRDACSTSSDTAS